MILTKQAQERIVEKYFHEGHTAKECRAFEACMDAVLKVIYQAMRDKEAFYSNAD